MIKIEISHSFMMHFLLAPAQTPFQIMQSQVQHFLIYYRFFNGIAESFGKEQAYINKIICLDMEVQFFCSNHF